MIVLGRRTTLGTYWLPVLLCSLAVHLAAPGVGARDETEREKLGAELEHLARLTITYASAAEGEEFEKARRAVHLQRDKIARRGPPALPAVMGQLRHGHVNVRRGAAILCYNIIEAADLPDQELLDEILLRVVEETDLKCRSNLSNVARLLVEDLVAHAGRKPGEKPAPAEVAGPGAYLTRFHELRTEQYERSRAVAEAQRTFYTAASEEARTEAFAKAVEEARALKSVLEKQVARLKEGDVPEQFKKLHGTHTSLLETALKGAGLLIEAADDEGPGFLDRGFLLPFGVGYEQGNLIDNLLAIGEFCVEQPVPSIEETYLKSLRSMVERSAESDADFLKASGMWRDATTRPERAKAMSAMAGALEALAVPLEAELGALMQMKPPQRYRDLHMAFEDALRCQAIACRKAPSAMRAWDNKGIGRWTSLLNFGLNLKMRVPGLLDKLSGR